MAKFTIRFQFEDNFTQQYASSVDFNGEFVDGMGATGSDLQQWKDIMSSFINHCNNWSAPQEVTGFGLSISYITENVESL